MTLLVGLLFLVLWAAALYMGIVIFGRRYFGPGRTETAATIATLAFVVGNAVFPVHPQDSATKPAPAQDVSARDAFAGANEGVAVEPCASVPLPPSNASAGGYIDYIHDEATDANVDENATIQTNQSFFVVGWAADTMDGALARAVCIAIDGHILTDASVTYGLRRPDVAAALRSPSLVRVGFRIRVGAGALSPGHHRLEVMIVNKNGDSSTLPRGRAVEVI